MLPHRPAERRAVWLGDVMLSSLYSHSRPPFRLSDSGCVSDSVFLLTVLSPFFQEYGIPKHFGLFYAMGIALMMEGVLSACYHVCPNYSNFQFGN